MVMRERARETRPDVTLTLDVVQPDGAGDEWDAAFERRIRDVASRAVAHIKRGDRVVRADDGRRRRPRRPHRRAPTRCCATSRSSSRSRPRRTTPVAEAAAQ